MRKLFWVALGAVAGVLIVRKLSKTAEQFTPEGLADSASRLADAARDIATTIREGMAEREEELRIALGIDSGVIDPETAKTLLEDPTARH
jgi:uncharacterized protein with PhoU and TrkA domain